MDAGVRKKGVSMPRTKGPTLERLTAIKNPTYSDSIGRYRERPLTPSSTSVRLHDEDWAEFSVHGKPDIQEMSMMLREIGLSPIELGIQQDDWNRVRQRDSASPPGNARPEASINVATSNNANGEEVNRAEIPREETRLADTHRDSPRSPLGKSPLSEDRQRPGALPAPAERTFASAPTPASASALAVAVSNSENGHTGGTLATSPESRALTAAHHPIKKDGSRLRCASLPVGIEFRQEELASKITTERQVEVAESSNRIERSRSEPLSGDLNPQPRPRTSPTTAPSGPGSTITNGNNKQQQAAQSTFSLKGSLSLPLKPPPGRSIAPVAPPISTEEMINSLAPDAYETHRFSFSDSDGEKEEDVEKEDDEEEGKYDSSEQSPAPSSSAEEARIHPTDGAELASGEAKELDEPKVEHVNETDGLVKVVQTDKTLTVEPVNGNSSPMDLTTVSASPRNVDQPMIPRTSSLYADGPKRPWNKGNRLGAGTFGTVFGAIDSGGMFFAVKEVSIIEQDKQALQALAQLKQELELLKRFKHENIVQYLGTEQVTDKLYIFLEYVELGSLAYVYKNYEKLEEATISKYTGDILRGLEYLHDRNILHRDVKCANVLVDKSGTCKLADFGMAKQISSLNLTKSCMGSAYWMAPEVINPNKTYGLPCDIWSLGCSVLEMATRAPPFGEMEWYRAMFMVGRGNAPPIPDHLSDSLRNFVKLCCEVEPMKRPTAKELLQHPFILQSSGMPVNSTNSILTRSATNLQPITEERSSDFSTSP